jgi:hypothetical protein
MDFKLKINKTNKIFYVTDKLNFHKILTIQN